MLRLHPPDTPFRLGARQAGPRVPGAWTPPPPIVVPEEPDEPTEGLTWGDDGLTWASDGLTWKETD